VPDVPLFYFISTILAHSDVFRQSKGINVQMFSEFTAQNSLDLHFFTYRLHEDKLS